MEFLPTSQANCVPGQLLFYIHGIFQIHPLFYSNGKPSNSDGKESACNAGDPALIPGSGRVPGEENGNPFQYSSLGNPMDRGAWLATVHGVAKSQTRLSTDACIYLGFLLDHRKLLEYWFYVFSPLVCGMELHSTQRKQ